jgi:ABC-type multidrug transport system ATPase subunit
MGTRAYCQSPSGSNCIGIINHGKLRAIGTVEEIRSQFGGAAGESLEELFLGITGEGDE